MGRLSTTVAGLGTPSTDGTLGIIRLTNGREEHLHWNAAQSAWIGRPRYSMRQIDVFGMKVNGSTLTWNYPALTSGLVGVDTGCGFQIHQVVDAGALYAAGLRLQEHLCAEMTSGDANIPVLALNWYELAAGDGFLSPVPTNQGVQLSGNADTLHAYTVATGWQNSPVAAPSTSKHYYSELYGTGSSGFTFSRFTARYRWVGGTVGSTGGSDGTATQPPVDSLYSWHVADNVPVADNVAVSSWPDYSGFKRHLVQATSSKQPILKRNILNGHAVVRFDGVDDILNTLVGTIAQPYTIFMALKQYAAGGTQQVWAGGGAAGAPLLYRGDATSQVNWWTNGTDITYARGSSWPSAYMIVSAVGNGASSSIWEDLTSKSTGNPGSGGLTGLTVGNNAAESLPATIDVAEVIVVYKAVTNTERTNVVNYLKTKYGI